MRKLSPALIALLGVLPQTVLALALGGINVQSGLNEPFYAEIELLAVRPGDLRDIAARLAPNSEFRRIGIQRTSLLSSLRFEIAKRSDGTPVVRVTSRRPITETYLDFLLELSRPNGRLLREYTVLLDPPEIAAPVAPTPAPPRRPAAEPRAEERPAAARQPAPTPPVAVAASGPATRVYGPTRRNDTLWEIAKRVRPDRSVSIHQAIIALQRANPEALSNGNVNNLKSGYTLTVPSREDMLALSKSEASREFNYQYEEWKAVRAGRTPPARPTDVPAQPRLTLTAPEPVSEPSPAEAPAPQPAAGGEAPADLARQRDLALERAHTAEQQVLELNRRQAELEQQLDQLKQLIALQDANIAALQDRVSESAGEPAAPGAAQPAAEPPLAPTPPGESAEPAEAMPSGAEEQAPEVAAGTEPTPPAAVETPAAEVESAAPAERAAPRQPTTPVAAPPTGTGGGLLDNPLFTPVLVTLLVALLGLAYWLARRRRGSAGAEVEPGEQEQEPLAEAEAEARTEAPMRSAEPAQPAKADLITEVELAIAYGQYQQAEDLLRRALTLEPSRIELQEKLLEVYFATDNRPGFDTLAGQFYASIGRDDQHPLWKRVADMGRKMFPGNPLFAGARAQQPPEPAAAATTAAAAATVGATAARAGAAEETGPGGETEFDLGLLDEIDQTRTTPPAPAAPAPKPPEEPVPTAEETDQATDDLEAELRRLEMELGGVGLGSEEAAGKAETTGELEFDLGEPATVSTEDRGAAAEPGTAAVELEGLDLSWMDEQPKPAPKPEEAPRPEAEAMPSMDFDLSDLEQPLEARPAEPEMSELAGGLDFETGAELAPSPAVAEEPTFDLGEAPGEEEIDEVGTKMELAHAYIDMGDPVSAREILEEVLREGNADQKREAEALIRKIS